MLRLNLHLNRTTDNWEPIYDVLAAFVAELKPSGSAGATSCTRTPLHEHRMERAAFRLGAFSSVGESHTDATVGFTIYTDKTKDEIYAELDAIVEKLRPMMEAYGVTTDGFYPTTRFFGYYETDLSHPLCRR
jgi:hypothetical protein